MDDHFSSQCCWHCTLLHNWRTDIKAEAAGSSGASYQIHSHCYTVVQVIFVHPKLWKYSDVYNTNCRLTVILLFSPKLAWMLSVVLLQKQLLCVSICHHSSEPSNYRISAHLPFPFPSPPVVCHSCLLFHPIAFFCPRSLIFLLLLFPFLPAPLPELVHKSNQCHI